MSNTETTRQLVKQTVEQELNLELQNRIFQVYVIKKLESHSQKSGTIMKIKKYKNGYLKSHSGLLTQVKQEISELMKEQLEMRNSQKRLQVIWIITFLTIAIPLSAFLGGLVGLFYVFN